MGLIGWWCGACQVATDVRAFADDATLLLLRVGQRFTVREGKVSYGNRLSIGWVG